MLWCCLLGAFGIKFIIYLAKFNSPNFAFKLTPWWFISDGSVSELELEIIRLLIDSLGAAFFLRLLSPLLLVTRFINSLSPVDKLFGIAVLSLNKALCFTLIKGVLTTIFLTGSYIKNVFKFSIVKNRPDFVFRANLWAFRLFSKGISVKF